MKRLLIICLFIACVTSSCKLSLIRSCIETEKTVAYAGTREDYKPINVEELRALLIDDTLHYKFVTIYSPCCGPCVQHMSEIYPYIKNKLKDYDVKWYYILENTGGIKHNDDFLQRVNLTDITKYYMWDTSDSKYSSEDGNKWNNIVQYIFKETPMVDDLFGIPINFIVSKDGKLKKDCYVYSDGTKRIHSTLLYDIKDIDLDTLDFDRLDTIRLDWTPTICYPDGTCR